MKMLAVRVQEALVGEIDRSTGQACSDTAINLVSYHHDVARNPLPYLDHTHNRIIIKSRRSSSKCGFKPPYRNPALSNSDRQ